MNMIEYVYIYIYRCILIYIYIYTPSIGCLVVVFQIFCRSGRRPEVPIARIKQIFSKEYSYVTHDRSLAQLRSHLRFNAWKNQSFINGFCFKSKKVTSFGIFSLNIFMEHIHFQVIHLIWSIQWVQQGGWSITEVSWESRSGNRSWMRLMVVITNCWAVPGEKNKLQTNPAQNWACCILQVCGMYYIDLYPKSILINDYWKFSGCERF